MNYADLDLDYDRVNLEYINNNSILVASLNDEYITQLKSYFSNNVKHARFLQSVKSGNWDGKIRFIQGNGLLPRGLLQECMDILDKWEIPYKLSPKLDESVINISNFKKIITKELIEKQKETMEPWEHQWDTAELLLQAKRGITKSATSSGKSYTITMVSQYLLYNHYVEKILLVVPRSDLVVQFQRDLEEYGFDMNRVGLYFGKVKDNDKDLLIATWQSLQNIDERDFFEQFDSLIIDECFTGNCLVSTEQGQKMIKDVKRGEKVWSYNEESKKKELKEIKKIYKNRTISKKLLKITLENGKFFRCTPNHLIKTQRGWVEAKDLNEEDELQELAL